LRDHQFVGVLDVLPEFVQRLALAKHSGDFEEATDEEVPVSPEFKREVPSHVTLENW